MTTPYSPSELLPCGGVAVDVASPIVLSWKFRDPINTDTQTAYRVQIKENIIGSTLQDTRWQISNQTQHIIPANTYQGGKTFAFRVQYRDSTTGENSLTPNQSSLEYSTEGWEPSSSSIALSLDASQKYEGNTSLKTVTTQAGTENYAKSSFLFPVNPGVAYTFSSYLNITSALTGGGTAYLKIVEYNFSGSQIASSTSATKTSTTNFERLIKTFTTNAATTHIELRLVNSGIGTVYWDAIQLQIGSGATSWTQGIWLNSGWSDWVVFKTSQLPQCDISYPLSNNDTVLNDFFTISHIYNSSIPQSSYQYRIWSDDEVQLLWNSEEYSDSNNLSSIPKGLLQNNTYYKTDVTVTDSDGLSTTSTKRRFYTNFPLTESNTPDFVISPENDFSRNKLKWINIKSKPFTYEGNGITYSPCKFGNGIVVGGSTVNLLTNPQFENDLTGWSSGTYGTLQIQTSEKQFETKALRIIDNDGATNAYISQIVPAKEGLPYTLSAYAKMVTGSQILYLDFLDSSLTRISVYTVNFSETSWTRKNLTYFAPAGTTQIKVWIYSSGISDGYWDGIQLEQKDHATIFTSSNRLSEKLYIDYEIPQVFTMTGWFKFN